MFGKIIRATLALAIGAFMTWFGALVFGERLPPTPVSAAELEPVFLAALDEPGNQLPEVDQGRVAVADGRARVDLIVPSGECVHALVAAATSMVPEQIGLFHADTREPLVWARDRRSAGLGWCTGAEPLPLTIWVEMPAHTAAPGDAALYRLHMGRPQAAWRRYLVGQASPVEFAELAAARDALAGEARDALEAPPAESVRLRADLEATTALALPLSDTTRWAARALADVGHPSSEHEPRLRGVAGTVEGTDAATALLDDMPHRLLAVVDPGDLPFESAGCVALHFTRLGERDAAVTRVSLPRLEMSPHGTDRVCPGDPITAFVTDGGDPVAWRVRALPEAGPGRRRPTRIPTEPLVAPAHRAALDACEAGDSAQCAEVARDFAIGRYVATDAEQASSYATRACLTLPEHCGFAGDRHADVGELAAAARAWERGCEEADDAWACARLGEARRLAEGTVFDPAGAHQAYSRACELGLSEACTRAATLEELQLAAP